MKTKKFLIAALALLAVLAIAAWTQPSWADPAQPVNDSPPSLSSVQQTGASGIAPDFPVYGGHFGFTIVAPPLKMVYAPTVALLLILGAVFRL